MKDVHFVFTEDLDTKYGGKCEVGPKGEVRLPLATLREFIANIGAMKEILLNVALPLSKRGHDSLWWVCETGLEMELGLYDADIKIPGLIAGCVRSR